MEHHGGHAAAAGFTVRNERLPELIQRMQEIAARQLSGVDLRRTLHADIELPLSDLKPYIIDYLKWLEPTGQENSTGGFVSRKLKAHPYTVGREGNHLAGSQRWSDHLFSNRISSGRPAGRAAQTHRSNVPV